MRASVYLWLEALEDRVLLSAGDSIAHAIPLVFTAQTVHVTQALAISQNADFFSIVLTRPGNISAQVDVNAPVSLTLFDANGIPIVQSDGQSTAPLAPRIDQGLSADGGGTQYYLQVKSLGPIPGSSNLTYHLTTVLTASDSSLQATPVAGARALATGDFNGDGKLDMAVGGTSSVTILLGNGDGTFQALPAIHVAATPQALVVGHFHGDNNPLDLACTSYIANDVTILLGNGDGTFIAAPAVPGVSGNSMVAADFNGDGKLDLAVANSLNDQVFILSGDGAGGFSAGAPISVPGTPVALVAGDFNGDGGCDLVTADRNTNQVTLLLNQPGGGFTNAGSFSVGTAPVALAAADFLGDGHLDLAVADFQSKDVTILHGDGVGGFTLEDTIALPSAPGSLVTADFNGDGRVDLAAADPAAGDLTVIRNDGGGVFHVAESTPVGANPASLVAGDFNGDGNVDLASANSYANNVTTLLGRGDGFFPQTSSANRTGHHPVALVQGDFNGDGRIDLATANYDGGTVTILLGQGDGTFQPGATINIGYDPVALVVGDFNRDGRLDLATANPASDNVTVLLGNGDGTFVVGGSFSVAGRPTSIVAGDFDRTGVLDLAVSLYYDASGNLGTQVAVLPGDGHGSFGAPHYFTVGTAPYALVAGDFNGDGRLDLAVADYNSEDVAVLIDAGGTFNDNSFRFQDAVYYSIAGAPVALVAGDFTGDKHLDLAVADYFNPSATLTVLHNDGLGSNDPFRSIPADTYALPNTSNKLVAGDFNGDGRVDLALANFQSASTYEPVNSVTVLLANGAGQFDNQVTIPTTGPVGGLAAGDFNGDGRLDLAATDINAAAVTVLLGNGAGDFVPPALVPGPVQSTPLVTPLSGTLNDAVVLTQAGQILFRRGLSDPPGSFAPPVVLNPDPAHAARAVAVIQATHGSFLAALEAGNADVTLYEANANGIFSTAPGLQLPAGVFPSNIASADLNNDGMGDLVITASGQLFVALQTSPGIFGPFQTHRIGINPSAIAFSDVNGDARTDIVVSDRFSGQVFLLRNQGAGVFGPAERYRAGIGLYDLTSVNGAATVQTLEETAGLVVGNFDNQPGLDGVALNSATQSVTFLSGDLHGGFLNPRPAFFTTGTPTALVAGDFNNDGKLDIAVLCTDTGNLSVYRGDGAGNFSPVFSINVGTQPTGLSVADITRPGGGGPDGIPDLLVGSALGDLLILAGKGDGSFSPYRRADQKTGLAIAPGAGKTSNTFYFSDHAGDQLAYSFALADAPMVTGPTVFQDQSAGIQAPGAEALVTVQGVHYLAVLNSGSNQLLIFTIGANGLPIPESKQVYFTGTNPVGLAITGPANDLNGDAIPDIAVANEGSNDVSIFIGALTGGAWSLSSRPRTGGGLSGPTSIAIADVTGFGNPNTLPDLVVSNSQTNQVRILANRGDGFFAADPTSFATGTDPQQVLVGNFDTNPGLDLVTINTGSNDVTLIANFLTAPIVSTISSGGTLPEAAVAVEFNGVTSLVVANAGNGMLEVLTGTAQGFEINSAFSVLGAPHVSDLSLVAAGNGLDLYGSAPGRDVAVLLGTFGVDVSPRFVLPSGPGLPQPVVLATIDGPAFVDTSFVFAFPVGATVDVAFNDVAGAQGAFAVTTTIADAPDQGSGFWVDNSGNPSRILTPNIFDSFRRTRMIPPLPEEEAQSDEFAPAWLLQESVPERVCDPGPASQPIVHAGPDATIAPIPLHVAAGPRSPCRTIELHPAPRSEQSESAAEADQPAPLPVTVRTAEPLAKRSVWDFLGACAVAPIVLSRLIDSLRPGWRRLQGLLRKVPAPGEPKA